MFLRPSEVYCLCCRSQWHPRLETTNGEWIWDDSYKTWNFAANQAICLQICIVLRWSSGWRLWEFYLIIRRSYLRNNSPEDLCSYNFFFIVIKSYFLSVSPCVSCAWCIYIYTHMYFCMYKNVICNMFLYKMTWWEAVNI